MRKVSEHVRDYIIELRRINNIDIPVPEVTEKALIWAQAHAQDNYDRGNLYHSPLINPEDYGLIDVSENLTTGMPLFAYENEKEIAYDLLLRFFNDYRNMSSSAGLDKINYGHRTFLFGGSGTGMAVGVAREGGYGALSFVTDDASKSPYIYSAYMAATVTNEDDDPARSEYYFDGRRVKFLPKTTFRYVWEETRTSPNTQYTNAKRALDEFNQQQATAERNAQNNVTNISGELTKTRTRLDDNKELLKSTQEQIQKLSADNATKNEELRVAREELEKENNELSLAKKLQNQEKNTLDSLTSALDTANETLLKAQESLKECEDLLHRYLHSDEELEQATKALEQATEDLGKAEELLEKTSEDLEEAKRIYSESRERYLLEKEIYDDLKMEYDEQQETIRLALLQEKYNQLVASGKKPIPVIINGVIVDYTYETVQSVKATSAVLPKTGENIHPGIFTAATLSILVGLGLVTVQRRKEDY